MAVHEANCKVKYTTWPSVSTTVDNEEGTATYDGTEDANRYLLLDSGATAQVQSANTHKITVPHGTNINTLTAFTMEWLFKYNSGSPATAYLWNKKSQYAADAGVKVYYVKATDRLYVSRSTGADTYDFDTWYCTAGMSTGNWYDIQVSWGALGTTPLIKVNNASKTVTHSSAGTGTGWDNDDDASGYLLNIHNSNAAIWGTLTVFRLHNTNLSSAYLTDNYNVDWPRVAMVNVDAVVATATAAAPTPAVATAINIDASVATATAAAPTPIISAGDINIDAFVATATASAPAPVVLAGEMDIAAIVATATAAAPIPVITVGPHETEIIEIEAAYIDITEITAVFY